MVNQPIRLDSPLAMMQHDMGDHYIHGQHFDLINEYLLKVDSGEIDKLQVILPPRHGKSTLISTYFPAWYALKHPKGEDIMMVSYGKELIEGFTLEAREIAREYGSLPLDNSWQRKDSWRFERPFNTKCFCMGVGGPLTGRGSSLLILDDLIKGSDEALNQNHLNKLREWYSGTLLSRIHKNAKVVSIGTRWSPDDLISEILEEDGWTVLDLPVYAEENDAMNRKEGSVLWPEHLDKDFIEDKRKRMGEYWFTVEYMGRPYSKSGNELEVENIDFYYRNSAPREHRYRVLYCDPAFTPVRLNPKSDESVISILDFYRGHFYLEKQIFGRWDSDELKKQLTMAYNYWHPDVSYIEQVSASVILLNDLITMGYPFMADKPGTQKKENKIREIIPYLTDGRIHLKTPKDNWEGENSLLQQIAAFPMARFDDKLDSLARAVHYASKGQNPYTDWDGSNAYEFSNAGMHQKDERPKSIFYDSNNNPYSTNKGRKR